LEERISEETANSGQFRDSREAAVTVVAASLESIDEGR
jgi:hypothetical protein